MRHIQQLNQNCITLEKNIQYLEKRLKDSSAAFTSLVSEMVRDSSAFQRALLEFLKEKKIICSDEDLKRLERLHLRHAARIDQEIAQKKDELKESGLDTLDLI